MLQAGRYIFSKRDISTYDKQVFHAPCEEFRFFMTLLGVFLQILIKNKFTRATNRQEAVAFFGPIATEGYVRTPNRREWVFFSGNHQNGIVMFGPLIAKDSRFYFARILRIQFEVIA